MDTAFDAFRIEEIYAMFQAGFRRLLLRTLGPQDIDDRLHDCFVIVLQAIRSNEIKQPERVMGFAKVVVRRHIYRQIEAAADRRKRLAECDVNLLPVPDRNADPERSLIRDQSRALAQRVIDSAAPVEREIIRRFYLDEQPKEKICDEMRMTLARFNAVKMRAKARLANRYREMAA